MATYLQSGGVPALQAKANAIQSAFSNNPLTGLKYFDAASGAFPFLNYGSGNNSLINLGATALSAQAALPEKPIFDQATGLYKSSKTGVVWTGPITQANGTMAHAQNGKLLPTDAYGNVLPVITPITTVKQPAIAAAGNALLASPAANTTGSKSFADYLTEAKAVNEQSKAQLATDQAAVNPADTIARLNTGATKTTAALNANDRSYVANQQDVLGKVTEENASAADTTTARLAKLKSDLDNQNAQYEKSAQDVAGQAWARAQQQLKLYQLGSSTPTSASGNLSNRYLRAYANINIPLQQDLAARRYSQTAGLDAQQQQADADRYNHLISQFGAEGALNTDIANRTGATAQYTGQLDANTALQVQQLRQATAGMSRAQAAQYLQQLAIPFDVGQHVLSGDISNLAGAQNVELGANYYTVNTPYDASRIPASVAPVPSVPRGSGGDINIAAPSGGGTSANSFQVSASTPSGGGAPAGLIQVSNGVYQNPTTRAYYVIRNGQLVPYSQNVQQVTADPRSYLSELDRNYQDVYSDY